MNCSQNVSFRATVSRSSTSSTSLGLQVGKFNLGFDRKTTSNMDGSVEVPMVLVNGTEVEIFTITIIADGNIQNIVPDVETVRQILQQLGSPAPSFEEVARALPHAYGSKQHLLA